MTGVEPGLWTTVADVVAAVFLLLGSFLTFTAGVGVLRLPDLLARMHAVTKPQVLGLVLLCCGVVLRVRSWTAVTLLAIVIVFQLLTSPVAAQMVGHRACGRGRPRARTCRCATWTPTPTDGGPLRADGALRRGGRPQREPRGRGAVRAPTRGSAGTP